MASPASAATATTVGLSLGGKIFFGGLTAGTFGLGCWQTLRYFEKVEQVNQRQLELAMEPTTDWENPTTPYRKKLLQGKFLHYKEVLIGPRGDPGAKASGGMGPSPQGYLVLTPLQLNHQGGQLVWINRGWVPRTMVPGSDRTMGRSAPPPSRSPPPPVTNNVNQWDRPTGTVQITAIGAKPESPRVIKIEHDYSKRPLQLFWVDPLALQAIAESEEPVPLLTQVVPTTTTTESSSSLSSSVTNEYPRPRMIETVAEFKVTPATHVGYAVTWYGLSAAGIYMTRKLITRGRG